MTAEGFTAGRAEVQARVSGALSLLARPRRFARVTFPPAAYVRRHGLEHALAGGGVDERWLDPMVLPYLDPTPLAASAQPAVRSTASEAELLRTAAGLSSFAWSWDYPERNSSALGVWGTILGGASVSCLPGAWQTRWGRWRLGAGRILTRGIPTRALCELPRPSGSSWLASAGFDGTVRVWDPATGGQVGDPLTGRTAGVCPLPQPDGSSWLASARFDGTVRVWDPATGGQVGDPLTGHTGPVLAVCPLPQPDGSTWSGQRRGRAGQCGCGTRPPAGRSATR